jgi:hypothetical protein
MKFVYHSGVAQQTVPPVTVLAERAQGVTLMVKITDNCSPKRTSAFIIFRIAMIDIR